MNLWKVVLGLGIFFIVGLIIAYIDYYKEYKKFMNPKLYVMNIAIGINKAFLTFFGVMIPSPFVSRNDAYYYYPTPEQFQEAFDAVRQMMIEQDWTVSKYLRRSKDCEDYAMKMSVEIRNYIAVKWTETVGKKGVAVGIIGYTRQVDGVGHVIVFAKLSNKTTRYQEPYPEDQYMAPKILSKPEIDGINMNIM